MSLFRSIVFASVLVGLIVGVAVSAAQFLGTSQLILKAEVYEKAGEAAEQQAAASSEDHSVMAAHDLRAEAWEPADGLERRAYTVVANVLTAIGYALVLTGIIAIRGKPVTWREGLIWGLAGFACVMLAPMLGLPPELPGAPSAPLADRQIWWMGTAFATAVSIGLAVLVRKPWAVVAAVVLAAIPHLIGAPAAPDGAHALAPEALERQFIENAVMTSLVFWLLLGSLSGTLLRRFET
ncbi:CbtA family protein [Mesorhizobium amorphae]|uniref:CbtA family protein n=1 Tax=Mesorhizobium amorphae TaxID=71433 RepID=UPI00177C3CF9|nr:CbtA family protein [Mesorhizobium amorphae]